MHCLGKAIYAEKTHRNLICIILTIDPAPFINLLYWVPKPIDGHGCWIVITRLVPPECVTSVTANFRTTRNGQLAATNITTNTQTEIIQTSLQCGTRYYIRVVVSGKPRYQGDPVEQFLLSNQV